MRLATALLRRVVGACNCLALVLLAAGCSDTGRSLATLPLHDCHLPKLAQPAMCGELAVPENANETNGRTLKLFVAVLPANTRSPKPDPLVLLPGGPGQAASTSLGPFAQQLVAVRRTRDIVLVDPRGTGRSAPLDCPAFAPEAREEFEIDPMPKVKQCLAELQQRGVDLRQYTTTAAVADLEAVRSALGYPQLNLWGGSYGSRVALEYLRRHPANVRTVVLDGVAPPDMRITLDVWRTRELALDRILAACKASPKCSAAHHDPAATLQAIAQDLGSEGKEIDVADPRTGVASRTRITFDHVVAALHPLTYSPEVASLIPEALDRAQAGDYGPLAAASVTLTGDLSEQLSPALHYAVTCAEDVPRIRQGETHLALMGMRSAPLAERIVAVCDVWPHGSAPADFATPVTSDKPVLLLSGGLDPVTPPEYATEVARTLRNSKQIVATGFGHIVSHQACAPQLIATFIADARFDTLSQSCIDYLQKSTRPPFFTDRLAAQP
ncbi:MAG TPA: alpha/beta hydrolase [Casimicrobiaceae bacterium]|nr:alpha/beta hydrolase [Casimicrobiaceae bacterium]